MIFEKIKEDNNFSVFFKTFEKSVEESNIIIFNNDYIEFPGIIIFEISFIQSSSFFILMILARIHHFQSFCNDSLLLLFDCAIPAIEPSRAIVYFCKSVTLFGSCVNANLPCTIALE